MSGSCGLLGSSWVLLGPSWRPLGASLGALGGVLGPLERLLGASWGLFGAFGANLGATKTTQKQHAKKHQFSNPSRGAPSKFLGVQKGAKIDQNRTPNESKFNTICKSDKVALQDPLGAVLGHFGGHLGVQNSAPVLEFVISGENSRFWC